jgi:hypothetical protein
VSGLIRDRLPALFERAITLERSSMSTPSSGRRRALTTAQQEQIAYLAVPKCIPARTLSQAKAALAEGESFRVKATVTFDGVISRDESTESVAESGPLKTAMLACILRDMNDEMVAKYRKRALKLVHEAIAKRMTVNKLLEARSTEYAALMSDLDAEAAAELPMKPKSGSIRMKDTDSWIESVNVEPMD